jgi:hypothetical protein
VSAKSTAARARRSASGPLNAKSATRAWRSLAMLRASASSGERSALGIRSSTSVEIFAA